MRTKNVPKIVSNKVWMPYDLRIIGVQRLKVLLTQAVQGASIAHEPDVTIDMTPNHKGSDIIFFIFQARYQPEKEADDKYDPSLIIFCSIKIDHKQQVGGWLRIVYNWAEQIDLFGIVEPKLAYEFAGELQKVLPSIYQDICYVLNQ